MPPTMRCSLKLYRHGLPLRSCKWRCDAAGGNGTVKFHIRKRVQFGHRVGILGEPFGQWAPDKAVVLDWREGDLWASAPIPVDRKSSIECKFAVLSGGKVVEWQPGPNLVLRWTPEETADTPDLTVEATWEGTTKVVPQSSGAASTSQQVDEAIAKAPLNHKEGSVKLEPSGAEAHPSRASKSSPASAAVVGWEAQRPAAGKYPRGQPASSLAGSSPASTATSAPHGSTVPAKQAAAAPPEASARVRAAPLPAPSPSPTSEITPAGGFSSLSGRRTPAGSSSISLNPADAARAEPSPPPRTAALGSTLEKMTVPQLKVALKEKGLPVSGKKAELVARLRQAG